MQQGLEKFRHRVHAYCLMDNHVHLALQVTETPLSKVMQNLCFRYTQHINRKQERIGHLFQGRFKALLIDEDSYLLELVRYIHLNPLRAGMVNDLNDYPWSSHGCYLGQRKTPWLTTDWVLSQWDSNSKRAQQVYQNFFQEGFEDGYIKEFHQGTFEGRALGDDHFIEQALTRAEQNFSKSVTIGEILGVVCDHYETTLETLSGRGSHKPFAEARAVAAWLVRQHGGLQLKALGEELHRDLSGLSQGARRIELRAIEDVELSKILEQLKNKVNSSFCQA
jgi:REP element-mobilizing transposase RayT